MASYDRNVPGIMITSLSQKELKALSAASPDSRKLTGTLSPAFSERKSLRVFSSENYRLSNTLNQLSFQNLQKKKQLSRLKKKLNSLETAQKTTGTNNPSINERIESVKSNTILLEEETKQLLNLKEKTLQKHLIAKSNLEELQKIHQQLTKNFQEVKFKQKKAENELYESQYETLKMRKTLNHKSNQRTQELHSKEKLKAQINSKSQETLTRISNLSFRKAQLETENAQKLENLEKNIKELNANKATRKEYHERYNSFQNSIESISNLLGLKIDFSKNPPLDNHQIQLIISQFHSIAFKTENLEKYYFSLVENQKLLKHTFINLEFDLSSLKEYPLELHNRVIEKSSKYFKNVTFNKLPALVDIEKLEIPSTKFEDLSVNLLLNAMQILKGLMKKIELIAEKSHCNLAKELVKTTENAKNRFLKGVVTNKTQNSSELYQIEKAKHLLLQLFPQNQQEALTFTKEVSETKLIKLFTTQKELQDCIKTLTGTNYSDLEKSIGNLIKKGSQNFTRRAEVVTEFISYLVFEVKKLSSNQVSNQLLPALKSNQIFSELNSSQPSFLKRYSNRSSRKKNTFVLKDDFENYVNRFYVSNESLKEMEFSRKNRIQENYLELFEHQTDENPDFLTTQKSPKKKDSSKKSVSLPFISFKNTQNKTRKDFLQEIHREVQKESFKIENDLKKLNQLEKKFKK